jgi:hypothetical protein
LELARRRPVKLAECLADNALNEVIKRETDAMEIDDPKIVALLQKVTAAQQEFDMAEAFHKIWEPAAN